MAERWRLRRGALVEGDGVSFTVWAPRADGVQLLLRDADVPSVRMQRGRNGLFTAHVADLEAGAMYAYSLDGAPPRPDPVSRHQPEGVHGWSRVVDPAAYVWNDHGWAGRELADYVLYELHVGTFTAGGTFDAVISHLHELRALGVTAIELMPVAQFPGARNWGYDGVHLYAVQDSYGGPEALRRLVDAAHLEDLAVVLDVVYNHFGPEGNYLGEFGPYFTDKYRTPWGSAVNYDDAGSDDVRRFVLDNARHWVTEYHIDGLRLDAIHAIHDFGARHILADIADEVRGTARALGRTAVVVGESDLNDPRVVRGAEAGGHGLDGQWADDLHHAVHSMVTGEQQGYYSDFASPSSVARAFASPFVYEGQYSGHRDRAHGAPAEGVPRHRFVVASQNHDQVGNRAAGDRLTTMVSRERRHLAAALIILSPYVPLLFMGEEYGERNPFLYFVSHGSEELQRAAREGRRNEFASFGWGSDVPDPSEPATFERSRLDRSNGDDSTRRVYRELLTLRGAEPALRPGNARVRVIGEAPAFAVEYEPIGEGALVWVGFNLSDGRQVLRSPQDDVHLEPFGFAVLRRERP